MNQVVQIKDQISVSDPAEQKKLTDWTHEPTLQDLCSDLEASKPAQKEHIARIQRWRDLYSVTGSAKPPKVKGRSSLQPKLVRRQAEWRYAALSEPFLSSDQLYEVKPVTFEDSKAAAQNSTVLNWQWRTQLNRVRFIDEYIRTAVDEGTVIVRTGWKRVTKTVTKEVPQYAFSPVMSQEEVQMIEAAMMQREADQRTFDEQAPAELLEALNYYEETGEMVTAMALEDLVEVEEEEIILNRPTVSIIHPDNFFIDPSCEGDIDKAMFAVISFETNKADLTRQSDIYKNLDKIDWNAAGPSVNPEHTTNTPQEYRLKDPSRNPVVAYEYWGYHDIDGTGELTLIVATWVGNALIRMERSPMPYSSLPFVVETYMPVKRSLMGEADAELLGDNQNVLGALMRGVIDLMGRSANAQQGFAQGMLDPINRRRFDNGLDYEYNPNLPTSVGHIEHKYPEIPQSALAVMAMQNAEAEAITGVKAFAGGMSGEAYGDVAAGIRGVLDASSKREMGILRRMANGIKRIGEKIIAMNSVFLSEEETIRVTNEEFITIKREDLAGNFDLIVDISTAEVDNKKAQDLGFMLQTLGNSLDQDMTRLILVQIAKLQRMPDLAKMIDTFRPEPDPLVEELKQLEVEKAKAEIAKINSEIELNQARARKELEMADKVNLDVVEQETGTQHERDMQKQSGQAQGNQDYAITQALTKGRKQGEAPPDIEAAIGYNELTKTRNSPAGSMAQRDQLAAQNPAYSIGSQSYDPALDPASNLAINLAQ